MNFSNIFLGSFLLIFMSSCGRPVQDELTKMSISIPSKSAAYGSKNKTALTSNLMHLVINVTGPNMPTPILLIWDQCHDCQTMKTVPTSFPFDVPGSTNLLIQIMAVYKDLSTGTMVFKYGDVNQYIKAGANTVDVPVTDVGGGDVITGNISGRYLSGVDSGPTDLVDIKYSPGPGKNDMVIQSSSILNGWFSFFGISGSGFKTKYVLRNSNQVMWGSPMSIDDFAPEALKVIRGDFPVFKRYDSYNMSYSDDEATKYVWGVWSDGSTAGNTAKNVFNVCYAFGTFSTSRMYKTPGTVLGTTNVYNGGGSFYSNSQLLDKTAAGAGDFKFSDSSNNVTSTVTGNCDGAKVPFKDYYLITTSDIDGNGKESAAGFLFPFLKTSSPISSNAPGSIFKKFYRGQESIKLMGSLLPGAEAAVDDVWIYSNTNGASIDSDGIDCNKLSENGFTLRSGSTFLGAILKPNEFVSQDLSISTSDILTTDFVMCPMKNGNFVSSGIASKKNYIFNTLASYIKMSAKDSSLIPIDLQSGQQITSGACYELTVSTLTAAGSSDSNGGLVSIDGINYSIGISSINFYTSNYNCTNSISPTSGNVSVSLTSGVGTVWFKPTFSASAILKIKATGYFSVNAYIPSIYQADTFSTPTSF